MRSHEWQEALDAAREGRITFEQLAFVGRAQIQTFVNVWSRRYLQEQVGREDVQQEVLIVVWRAIQTWTPEGGRALQSWVYYCVNKNLRRRLRGYWRSALVEQKYWNHVIAEEKVIVSEDDKRYHWVAETEVEAFLDMRRAAARVIGSMRSKRARVVVEVVAGRTLNDAVRRVYGPKCKEPRKAARRAIAAAYAVVESSTALEER